MRKLCRIRSTNSRESGETCCTAIEQSPSIPIVRIALPLASGFRGRAYNVMILKKMTLTRVLSLPILLSSSHPTSRLPMLPETVSSGTSIRNSPANGVTKADIERDLTVR